MKLALYTVTYSGIFYRGNALPLKEIIPKVADYGFDGIEIGAKRPIASPMDLDKEQRREIKHLAAVHKLEICCVASYSNFASSVMEQREAELLMLRAIIELAHDLECPLVRVFAGWPGMVLRNGIGTYEMPNTYKQPDVLEIEKWHWVRECLRESAEYAGKYGIVLALQNHSPVTKTYLDTIELAEEVGSEYLKVCIDAPQLARQDDEYIRTALKRAGKMQVHSHTGGWNVLEDDNVLEMTADGLKVVNYPSFLRGLKDIGYTGYMAYEGCGHAYVHHDLQGIEEVDRRVKLALDYFRRLSAKIGI